jgi:tRNA 2-thiouridine synthesizing protein C
MASLFIFNKPPYLGEQSKEALDMALALAAFDEQISLLFIGQGVWNLTNEQMPKLIGLKEFSRLFKGLELYDIEQVYLCEASMNKYQLTLDNLMINPELLSVDQIKQLIAEQDKVICL